MAAKKRDDRQPSLFDEVPAAVPAPVDVIGTEGEQSIRRVAPVMKAIADNSRDFAEQAGGAICDRIEDAGPETIEVTPKVEHPSPVYSFREVPASVFLAWSLSTQYQYCAARDRDSALREQDSEMTAFFLERAAEYEQSAYNAPVPF